MFVIPQSVGFSVFVLWLGVDFNLDVSVGVTLSFPPELISVNPPRIGLKVIKRVFRCHYVWFPSNET